MRIDKNGKETLYESAADAGRKLGINPGSISTVCSGSEKHRHTVGGAKWIYYDNK